MRTPREPAIMAVVGLCLFVASFALRPLDETAGRAVVGTPGLVTLAGGMAFLGGVDFLVPAIAVAVIALAATRRWWGALRLGLVTLTTDLTTRALKLVFARPRPEYMIAETGGFSFPSGHASSGAAVAVLLAWFATRHLKGRGLLIAALSVAVAYAAAMALSRMVLGVHYLSDVVAGVGVGMAVGGAVLSATVVTERGVERRRSASSPGR